jgi:hypothetical protein
MTPINLRELERVEVTILVDNYTDLLLQQSTNVVKRALVPPPPSLSGRAWVLLPDKDDRRI